MDTEIEQTEQDQNLKTLEELVRRAQQGDHSVLPELRRALDADPSIWQQYGNLGLQAQAAWVQLVAGQDILLRESLLRKLDKLRGELEGPAASPLERLVVERIVACWLQLHYADAIYAQSAGQAMSATTRQEMMRRQESSQKRYLAAIKQLALVRKLLRPSLSPLDLATRTVPESQTGVSTAATRKSGHRLVAVN